MKVNLVLTVDDTATYKCTQTRRDLTEQLNSFLHSFCIPENSAYVLWHMACFSCKLHVKLDFVHTFGEETSWLHLLLETGPQSKLILHFESFTLPLSCSAPEPPQELCVTVHHCFNSQLNPTSELWFLCLLSSTAHKQTANLTHLLLESLFNFYFQFNRFSLQGNGCLDVNKYLLLDCLHGRSICRTCKANYFNMWLYDCKN